MKIFACVLAFVMTLCVVPGSLLSAMQSPGTLQYDDDGRQYYMLKTRDGPKRAYTTRHVTDLPPEDPRRQKYEENERRKKAREPAEKNRQRDILWLVAGAFVLLLLFGWVGTRCPRCRRFWALRKTGKREGGWFETRSFQYKCKHCGAVKWKTLPADTSSGG